MTKNIMPASRRAALGLTVAVLIGVHSSLLAWSAWQHSPVSGEIGHLPAGLSHLYMQGFDLFRVNPPLVRTVAALPVAFASPRTDWKEYSSDPLSRCELDVGLAFVQANGPRSLWLFTLGRWACIPISLMGALVCFHWARELYGAAAGLLALALWCFCPNILAHASLITPDAGAAAFSVTACYVFWRWLKKPIWFESVTSGFILGLAELTKTTLVVFYLLWPVLWIVYRWPERRNMPRSRWLRETGMLLLALAVGIYVINLGYVFEGSFQRLGDYRFQSRALAGVDLRPKGGANRFADSWLAAVPIPLPRNYVQGIDAQKADFEHNGLPSYLRGQWSKTGWWGYFLYALAIKVPLGSWGLIILTAAVCLRRKGYLHFYRDELVLLLPTAVILVLVSSQSGFSRHLRYALPVFPFVFVWISKVAQAAYLGHRAVAFLAGALLIWSVVTSMWIYPHSLAYFNELVGGPAHGHEHLLGSNLSWGQDLRFLKRWYDEHPEARPFHLASSSPLDPHLVGIEFRLPPFGPSEPVRTSSSQFREDSKLGPLPGWFAVDVNYLQGQDTGAPNGSGEFAATVSTAGYNWRYFNRCRPLAKAGYSFYIYHVSADEADKLREELALGKLGSCRGIDDQ
jgi:hypothetical protein